MLRTSTLLLTLALTMTAYGCGDSTETDSVSGDDGASASSDSATGSASGGDDQGGTLADITAEQLGATWVRLSPPQDAALGELERIVQAPDGFVALYRRGLGDGKVMEGWESRLSRSLGGFDWTTEDLLVTDENQSFRDLAYGGGRFVVVGHRFQDGVIWYSDDLASWTELETGSESLQAVRYAGGRFYALGTQESILSSVDGVEWQKTTTETLQPRDLAKGEGALVLVGTGPFQRSEDGVTWSPHPVDCELPGVCVQDPGGTLHQPASARVFFAAGAFHVDTGWRSADGVDWQHVAEADIPDGHAGGTFFKVAGDQFQAWTDEPGDRVTLKVSAPTGPEDGCLDEVCVLLDDAIYRAPSSAAE
jgi:hypothetical protein